VRWAYNFYLVARQLLHRPSLHYTTKYSVAGYLSCPKVERGLCQLSSCDAAGFTITVAQRWKLQPDSAGRSWEEDQSSYSSYVTAVLPGLDKAAEIEERNFSTAAEPSLQNTHKRAEERIRTYVEHFAVIFILYYAKSPRLYLCVCVCELALLCCYKGILRVYWKELLLALYCTSGGILVWQPVQDTGI
jgi:hypothetical protein